jgi:hypothetical protein
MLRRSLAGDDETHPHRSDAMAHLAMSDLMARRRSDEATSDWCDI